MKNSRKVFDGGPQASVRIGGQAIELDGHGESLRDVEVRVLRQVDFGHQPARILHLQWREDGPLRVHVELLTDGSFDDVARQPGPDVRVLAMRPRL